MTHELSKRVSYDYAERDYLWKIFKRDEAIDQMSKTCTGLSILPIFGWFNHVIYKIWMAVQFIKDAVTKYAFSHFKSQEIINIADKVGANANTQF